MDPPSAFCAPMDIGNIIKKGLFIINKQLEEKNYPKIVESDLGELADMKGKPGECVKISGDLPPVVDKLENYYKFVSQQNLGQWFLT